MNNIRNYRGERVEILGKEYFLFLSMLGNDYLDEVFGSPDKAAVKYAAIRGKEIDKEVREVLCHFIHACLIHNAYDREGNVVREVPTAFELRSSLSQKELLMLFKAMEVAVVESNPKPAEGEASLENP